MQHIKDIQHSIYISKKHNKEIKRKAMIQSIKNFLFISLIAIYSLLAIYMMIQIYQVYLKLI
jgi:hypothetical protein